MRVDLSLMFGFERKRTNPHAVLYGLYLYFLGLSLRNVSLALDPFVNRSQVAVWKWIQRFNPQQAFDAKRVQAFLVDETYVKVGSFEAWVWVAVEPIHRFILGVYLSRHQNILVAELFLKSLVEKYGRHLVYSDGGTWYPEGPVDYPAVALGSDSVPVEGGQKRRFCLGLADPTFGEIAAESVRICWSGPPSLAFYYI